MANYATNTFYARTENRADLDKIEAFLDDTSDGLVNRHNDSVDAGFTSRWAYPKEEIGRLIASLGARNKTYIKIPSHEFTDEYVSSRIFSQGRRDIKL